MNGWIGERLRGLVWRLGIGLLTGGVSLGAFAADEESGLIGLSIEELMSVEVTSVSKSAESKLQVPSAVYVLTSDDIRRSGAANIADALRLVPGVSVAYLNSHSWSITARGFGGRYSNKLLVLVDGLAVYNPLFSGTYWEVLYVPLEDVDRIEVIRGPGGAVWGANAVNGVINIITKHARDTQGGLLRTRAGTAERASGLLRLGGATEKALYYRVFAEMFSVGEGGDLNGIEANDEYVGLRAGTRLDWDLDSNTRLMVSANAVRVETDSTVQGTFLTPPYERTVLSGNTFARVNVLAKWERELSDIARLQVRGFVDHWQNGSREIYERRSVVDFDTQYEREFGSDHLLVMGGGINVMWDEIESRTTSFSPDSRTDLLPHAFFQTHLRFFDRRLQLTLGSKFEHNDYTGFEIQPTVRLAYTPNEKHTAWASATRAVRTPSRSEFDIKLPNLTGPGFAFDLVGDEDFHSEVLLAYELGYRYVPMSNFALDLTVFWNEYEDLRTIELGFPRVALQPSPPHVQFPFFARNNMEATTYGAELVLDWRPISWWRIRASYSWLHVDLDLDPVTIDIVSGVADGDAPEHQAWLWNSFEITDDVSLDAIFRYVDALPALGVEDYITMDLRVAWTPREDLELALVGRNLIESGHQEYSPTFISTNPTEVERSIYAEISWTF